MPAKKKKYHKKSSQSKLIRLVLVSFLIIIILVYSFFQILRSRSQLTQLPVPKTVTHMDLSGPLMLPSIDLSVMGAQTIDPVDFVDEINKERAKVDAPPLRLNTVLMQAAKMRADVIMKYQNFSHTDPHEGIELGTILPQLGYSFVYATENIGMGGLSASDFVNGFMHSSAHRGNLLNPRLTETGAAIMDGPYFQYYVNIAVQLFTIPGGRDEYLGYTESDRALYEDSLLSLAVRLNPMNRLAQQLLKNPEYSDKRILTYTRQKEILVYILDRMRRSEPLGNVDVSLILEYNKLLEAS